MTKIFKLGGNRPGAGRPKGTGRFQEKTRPIRVPESLVPQIHGILESYVEQLKMPEQLEAHGNLEIFRPTPKKKSFPGVPLFSNRVAAGFPSPTEDYIEAKLDLNEHLVKHPAATFFVRVIGDSMIGAGIHEDDILVVDRAIKPTHGKVVIAVVNGELTVKRLSLANGRIRLEAENKNYPPIIIQENMEFSIWGVVTNVIHAV